MASKEQAEKLLESIPEGGCLASDSGGIKVTPAEGGGFRWLSGKVETEIDHAKAIKRLTSYKPEALAKIRPYTAEDISDKSFEQRIQADKALSAAGVRGSSKTGAAKAKKAVEVPKGFKIGVGADLVPGDQVVTDGDRGAEQVVSIGSGGVSRGRQYLKLMLEPVSGGAERRRFISPRKEYPLKKATKAEAEKAAKKLEAAKKPIEKIVGKSEKSKVEDAERVA